MQWRAMSYLDHDIILGADFKNLWAVDTQTVEGEWLVHKGSWMPFYREGTSSEADILVECASLAIASAAEQACIKALLDRVLGEHEDSEAESLECAGLSEITPEQEAAIRVVVDRMMTAEPGTLGLTRLTEHHIDVQGASPIKHKMRRMSPPMLQVAHDEVKKMLAEGVIEPSASSWSSAPVIVKKADGSNRFCIDYRDLNKVTKKDAYPVQNIDAILDKLRRARYITTIDLKSAYFQIAMEESSKKYTASRVPGAGLFQFTRLAFGQTNAPMTFQRLIDALFGPECEPFVFGYLDDIVIVTETFEQHLVWLEKVLERLNAAGLTINRKKCEFCRPSVKYLGYVLDGDGLRVDEDKVAPVMNYPAPTDLKSLRRFLGMLGWYARFIPNDTEMKLPLLKLTKKNAEWIWADEQQQAFEALKKALTEAPVLARPDFARPFIVQCDASALAIGGVLSQVFDDGEHPIVYVSRVLTSAERNYTTSEKECLALLWTIRKLRPYLEGYKFIAVTDHSALQYLRNLKDPTGRLARWALEMQQWEFEIVHRRGKVHELPDALSRAYEANEEVCVAGVSDESDEEQQRLVEDVTQNPQRWQNWRVEGGNLYHYRYDPLLDPITDCEKGWKLVVPPAQRERVMRDAHDITSAGHLGIEKTFDRVKREYYWRGMYHDVHEYVRSCDTCQLYKIDQTGPRGLMGRRVIEHPWSVIACDLMEFPLSKSQNKYLIVFVDLFTRWVEFKPVRRATGKAVASALEELVLFRWETPDFLICDNGKEQVNKDVTAVLDAYGIRQVTTAPYTPRMNPTERANRTIKTMIASYVGANHRDWDKHLHELRHAMNTAVQSSTRVSPAFLNYGRHPRPVKSLHREVETPAVEYWEIDETVWLDRISRLDAIRDLVKLHLDKAHARQARHYNRGRKDVRFTEGDLVMRRTHHLSVGADGFNKKLGERYEGPVKVLKVLSPSVYVVETPNDKRVAKVDVNELKRYIQPRKTDTQIACTDENRVCVLAILTAHPALYVPSDDTADPACPVYVRGRQTGPEESSVLPDPGDEVVYPCGLGPRARVSVSIELIYYSAFRAGPRTTTQLECPPSVIVSVRASARRVLQVQCCSDPESPRSVPVGVPSVRRAVSSTARSFEPFPLYLASRTLVGDEHPLVWRVVHRQSRPGRGEIDTGGVHGEATVT
ncbi:unnamed protein product [Trichogramma brassicae]|uniref:RNA-directed DNA polymerase n=1 Tax=Trichogramma brassicae TaxID=86971 RepID=A0A6H5IRP4_9HYME|nr:unnamed protein product [Trichogramma brassicae]